MFRPSRCLVRGRGPTKRADTERRQGARASDCRCPRTARPLAELCSPARSDRRCGRAAARRGSGGLPKIVFRRAITRYPRAEGNRGRRIRLPALPRIPFVPGFVRGHAQRRRQLFSRLCVRVDRQPRERFIGELLFWFVVWHGSNNMCRASFSRGPFTDTGAGELALTRRAASM